MAIFVHTGGGGASAVQVAYSQQALYPFKNNLVFGSAAKEKVWDLDEGDPMPAKEVTFTLYNHFAARTAALVETADPTGVDLSMYQKTVTLVEYGNVVTRTAKFKAVSFLDVDPDIVFLISYNASTSLDLVARAAFDAESGVTWNLFASGNAVGSIVDTNTLTWVNVRAMHNKLFRANVPPPRMLASGEQLHGAIIHPDTMADLKAATGAGNWRNPKEYVDAPELRTGEMGANEGFFFQITNHARVQIQAGESLAGDPGSADVYTSYFYGYEAIGKANGNVGRYVEDDGTNGEFSVVISGPFDKLRRLRNIGWKALCGYGAIRTGSLFKYYHASAFQTQVAQDETGA